MTVLSGTLLVGHGDTLDPAKATVLPAGSYVVLPAGHHHYAMASTDTVIQIHAVGPLGFTYVNPADDPRNRARK